MMIKLENITKYYNQHKKNQLVVCNDITITFENTGLVVILGASGSGKTTLLNVISGMDKFDSGRLIFDDQIFEKYNHKNWDSIRKNKIGYIYQNYHLLKGLTVLQNIEPALRMQGFTDKEIIRNHIDRLLKAVGLDNYANRFVKQLSGGEQQRVAFARALANNPDVVLADEPTGNLDSKTTIEIMQVIKKISETRLVIMVTHESLLSDYYADRVIKLEKGKVIKDYKNDKNKNLKLVQEHIINLSDFQKSNIDAKNLNVNRYTNMENPEQLNIDLIERNQTLYLKVNSNSLKRIKYLDSDSEIVVQNSSETDAIKNPFVLEDIYPTKTLSNTSKIFHWKDIFRYAFRRLNVFHGGSKIWFVVLFVVGIIISISVGLIGEIYRVEEPYNTLDSHYITVNIKRTQYYDYQDIESIPGVDGLMLVNHPYLFSLSTPDYYEVRSSIKVEAQPVDIKFFDDSTLIYGQLPKNYDIVIDKSVADSIIKDNSNRGILSYDDVLNCKFKLQTSAYDTNIAVDTGLYYKISGIANSNSKTVWMKEDLLYSLVTLNLIDYHILGDNFHTLSGTLPTSTRDIMLNDHYPAIATGDGVPYMVGIGYGNYYVSGVYQYLVDNESYNLRYLVIADSTDLIKTKYFTSKYHPNSDFTLLVYATDVKSTISALHDAGYTTSANIFNPATAIMHKIQDNIVYLAISLVGLIISALSIYFIMRSSLISRIYEVSVYRAIGISRREIRRMFFVEILITTTFSSIIGFFVMLLLLNQVQSTIQNISLTSYNVPVVLLAILGMYCINILFGLIPINRLLHKTPSTIMKQSDL